MSGQATEQVTAPGRRPAQSPMFALPRLRRAREKEEKEKAEGVMPPRVPEAVRRFGLVELQGRGRRFVYLLDRSESMKWPDEAPMRFAVAEARQSIASLDSRPGAQKFQLIVFNHHEESFDGGRRLVDVTPEAQRRADEFLRALPPKEEQIRSKRSAPRFEWRPT